MKYCITVYDETDQILRTFQRAALTDRQRQVIDGIVLEQLVRVTAMSSLPPTHGTAVAFETLMPPAIAKNASTMTQGEMAKASGFTGGVCEQCGGFELVRTGTCETCQSCGWNKGCG